MAKVKAKTVVCQLCGVECPTKHISFHQNIGALIMRFSKSIDGNLCKPCINKKFWPMTLITLCVGWLGVLSLIMTPFILLNNIIYYIGSLFMPPRPPDAKIPEINATDLERFVPYAETVFGRVNKGESLVDVAKDMSPKVGLTPGQIIKCILQLIEFQKQHEAAQAAQQAAPIAPPAPAV